MLSKKKKTEDLNNDILSTEKNKSKKHKNLMKIQSTQAFSPIRDIKDGIIITKDRRFLKIMEISPINFLLRSSSEQTAIIQAFASVIKAMPAKVQFKVISRKSDVSGFVSKIQSEMETETNGNCITLQQEQINLISKVGMQEGISRRFFLIFEYEEKSGFQKSSSFPEIRASLNTTKMRIQNMLVSCGNEVLPLEDDKDILNVLYNILCKSESEQKAFELRMYETISKYLGDEHYNPDVESYIPINDFIMPNMINTRESSKYIIIDGIYYSYAYIPSKSYNTRSIGGWFSLLVNLGEGVDVDLFCRKEPINIVQHKLQYSLRFNKVKVRGMEDTSSDYDDVQNIIDSSYYIKQGLANGEDFWYFGIMLTITARTLKELEWKMHEIKMFLISQDIRLKTCWFQQEDAYLMSLPICNFNENLFRKSRRNILTSSLASAYPFVAFEMNDENGILFGINKANNSLVFCDNFDSKKYQNANMAILGMSGAGKTYTLQCLAMRLREQKTQVFIIAPYKGHEFIRACEAIGGEYIKICAGSDQNINIMEIRKINSISMELINGEQGLTGSILANKIQQLHTFFSLLIPDMNYEERQLLDDALVRTYARFGITGDNNSLISESDPTKYKKMPILGDLHEELKKGGSETRHLYNILTRFVKGSAKSFNGQTNVNLDNKYIVLDISELTKELQAVGMFIVLDYVWDKSREDLTTKKAIFLDELWKLIGAKGSVEAAEFVFEVFKLIRGYGGSAIAATQDLEDFFGLDDGRFGKAILNNAKIKMLLKLEPQEAQYVQQTFNLSDAEVQRITSFNRGEMLLTANSNHVIIDFKSSPTEHKLITTDRKELEQIVKENAELKKIPTNT